MTDVYTRLLSEEKFKQLKVSIVKFKQQSTPLYYLSFERVHLDNFLLGIQSYQCWTGPEMIIPLLVLTVKNQEMVYNPKIIKKMQHMK